MSPDLKFEPDSWDKAAQAFDEETAAFASRAQSVLSSMDVESMGATSSAGTVADAAFSIVFPVGFQAMLQTVEGLSKGLGTTATGMRETGDAYRGIELRNESVSDTIMED